MIEKMTKYSWILLSADKDDFLEKLRGLGVVDIKRSAKPVDERSQEYLNLIEEKKELLKCIVKGSDKALEELIAREKALEKEVNATEIWGDYDKAKLDAFGIRYYCVPEKKFDESWEESYPVQVVSRKNGSVWFVTLGTDDFPIKETKRPERTLNEVKAELAGTEDAIRTAKAEFESRKPLIPQIEKEIAALESDLSLYLASVKGDEAAEGHLVLFEGFAPETEREMLEKEFDSLSAIWTSEAATTTDNPPIKLRNNNFSKQFEVITEMYGMPCYNEFDPTIFLSIFFLLFFAMCMGDAGYGLVLMALGFILRGKDSGLGRIWRLIVILGAGTTVVGFIMGGFFGINLARQSWMPECLKKCMITGDITIGGSTYAKQMVLSLLIGIVHICLALIMKAVWAVRKDGFKNSLSALGWTLLIVGAVVALSVRLPGLISETALKWTLIGIGAVSALGILLFNQWGRNPLKNIGSGLWDTYSMASGLMGDVLSYIRLYALGLSGGLLGATFNQMAGMVLGDNPSWQWLPFILIVLFGHVLNIAMSCLGAFVHPLRLNFVEFFKNSSYEGKGSAYNPVK